MITHSDLPLPYQIPQTNHASLDFACEYPDEYKDWHTKSNSIITLSTRTERDLWTFCDLLTKKGQRFTKFREPDCGYAITAIAIVPGPDVKKICSGIPLAGKYNNPKAVEHTKALKDTIHSMTECFQSKGQNMLEHGLSVHNHMFDLVAYLKDQTHGFKNKWRMPSWFFPYANQLSENLCSDFTIDRYTIMHDCGKSKVQIQSENMGLMFPGHAQASYETWMTCSDDEEIGELIRRDMEVHTLKTEQVPDFCKGDKRIACTLLLTALAEIHSNAEMFGGMESDSFKIKFKHLEKKGKAICQYLFPV